jgi:hypothetical protein
MKPSRPSGPLQRLVRLFRWNEEWRVKDQQGHIWRGLRWGFPRSAIKIQILGRDGVTWYDNEALPAGIITFVEPNRRAEAPGSESPTNTDHAANS